MTTSTIWPGKPYPLGATYDGEGVNFAVFTENASAVELCLFDTADAPRESARVPVMQQTDNVWHVYLPGLKAGQLYGYRIYGPSAPQHGHRFNQHKLLLDPYSKAISGSITWDDAMYGYTIGHPDGDFSCDERDSAPYMPRSVVIDSSFDWGNDAPPCTPLHDSIIYETHVKGFTKLHPMVPEKLRGSYAGLAHPASVDYLKSIGVTAVELMPVHHFVNDRHLVEKGLNNYWGYNTLAFFAPDSRYSSSGDMGGQVQEFKAMVKTLHQAGLEVILDVVYNHTAEGNHLGPTLSMKGVDNAAYYRLVPDDARYYMDYTGTGNTLNMLHPRTLQLVMDSLRYWVLEMHVDGFRFDLAATLARGLYEGGQLSSFLDIIHQDPVLSQVKLIAEPWDVGPGGYQVGNFPVLWAEWNGKYRDTVRKFWKGDDAQMAELAYRLSGSSDLYQHNGRTPAASINFVTAHDGFTLRDLVSYNEKHNEANGEHNNDGESHNNSWNCGVEGETDDPDILALRTRQQRNMLATLLLSQGVPMLLAGDERSRSQHGNNNAYCQDNELSWLDWQANDEGQAMLQFTQRLVQLRKAHPVLHRASFFQGRHIHGHEVRDIEWYRPDGAEMTDEEWSNGLVRSVGMLLNGQLMDERDERGQPVQDDVLLLLLNAYHEHIPFTLPGAADGTPWEVLLDTDKPGGEPEGERHFAPGQNYTLCGRSLVLLRQQADTWRANEGINEAAAGGLTVVGQPLGSSAESTIVGTVITVAGLLSPELGSMRDIKVYLPPGYDDGSERFPVIYMHDGQNLFDEATSFANEWRVDETMEHLGQRGLRAIVVGIPNAGEDRLNEYSPFVDETHGGGRGDAYLGFIVGTLKPYIDRAFRSMPEREHTGIFGSSMGGLASLYGFFCHQETFGFVGAMSPALWFANGAIFNLVKESQFAPGKIYLDVGTEEGEETLHNAQAMAKLLRRKGYKTKNALRYLEEPGADHSEAAWANRLHGALEFLLG
ncbi:MAG: glycogen debranching protein GlgX [Chloroflexaceae bacterium]|nr:glycogen debranching protein GlgX [Chloroflexaceae bacterium]